MSFATVIYIASCWAVVYLAGTCARAGSWVDFGVLAMAATLFACLCGVSLVAAALSRSTEITAATNVSWSLAGWTVFNVVAYWTALNAFRTQGERKRRGALLQLAVRRASDKLRKAQRPAKDKLCSGANTMASWAIALSPFFPFGILLARLALGQSPSGDGDRRIHRKIRIALVTSWAVVGMLTAGLATLAIWGPPIQ